jgi:hypothetical protein
MCGGGPKGPSSEQLVAQERAAQARADAEIEKIKVERDLEKQKENAKMVGEQAAAAEADQARRARNRTLLSGAAIEEGDDLEDPNSLSQKKAKRATLITSI